MAARQQTTMTTTLTDPAEGISDRNIVNDVVDQPEDDQPRTSSVADREGRHCRPSLALQSRLGLRPG